MSRDVRLLVDHHLSQPFLVVDGHRIRLSADILDDPCGALVLLRHALELALWHRLAASRRDAGRLAVDIAACRVAGLFLSTLGRSERRAAEAAMPAWLLTAYELFAAKAPLSRTQLLQEESLLLVGQLARLRGLVLSAPDRRELIERAADQLESCWGAAAPVEHLLITGGGARLLLDAESGLNAYGCSPRPSPQVLAFGSSTASSISSHGYAAVEKLRQKLIEAALRRELEAAFATEIERTKRRLALICGIEDRRGIGTILLPSGTDGELAALHLARRAPGERIVNILMEASETGSGVPLAAQGLHYSRLTPGGAAVDEGSPIDGLHHDQVVSSMIELREKDGTARSLETIEQDLEKRVDAAMASGARCLLHVIDCSKSGLRAPSLDLASRLNGRYQGRVEVVVDACQTRLGWRRTRDYLDAGFMVLLTGSKFFMGPPFSGALLLPERLIRACPPADALPAGFGDYFSRPEWPQAWSGISASLPNRRNLGLLLRWEAALYEMEAFEAVPQRQRSEIMSRLAEATGDAIRTSAHLRLITPCHPWDDEQPATIFAFEVLHGSRARAPLDQAATKRVHEWLRLDISPGLLECGSELVRIIAATECHVGQPIRLGRHAAALRICIGARHVREVAFSSELGATHEQRLERQIERMRVVVQKAELIAQHFGHLATRAGDSNARAAAGG